VNNNGDSGIALFESHRNDIINNRSVGNSRGIRLSVGSEDNEITGNLFQDSGTYGIYFYKGSDAPMSGDGRPKRNVFENNEISGGTSYALQLKQADDNIFRNNDFIDNSGAAVVYMEDAHQTLFVGNTMTGNTNEFYYAKKTSDAEIINTPEVDVKIGDSASTVLLRDEAQHIFATTRNAATRVTDAETSATLKRTLSTGVMSFFHADVTVDADAGSADVKLASDYELGDDDITWTARAIEDAPELTYVVSGLTAGDSYEITRDGTTIATETADGSGNVTFSDSLSDTTTHTYNLSPA
jgi:hypothetical protein